MAVTVPRCSATNERRRRGCQGRLGGAPSNRGTLNFLPRSLPGARRNRPVHHCVAPPSLFVEDGNRAQFKIWLELVYGGQGSREWRWPRCSWEEDRRQGRPPGHQSAFPRCNAWANRPHQFSPGDLCGMANHSLGVRPETGSVCGGGVGPGENLAGNKSRRQGPCDCGTPIFWGGASTTLLVAVVGIGFNPARLYLVRGARSAQVRGRVDTRRFRVS